jgi:AcrR family transcriptional regulator
MSALVQIARGSIPDLILDATERLLRRYGYRKMTMDDIAVEADVGRRTIYLHFASKEEVALTSIDRVVARVIDALRAIAASRRAAPERLHAMLVARVLVRFDSVAAYHGSLDSLFETLRPAYMERRRRYFDDEAQVFAAVLADRAFSVDDPVAAAHDLLLATNSLLPYSLSAKELGERAAVERRITRLAGVLLHGVVAKKKK